MKDLNNSVINFFKEISLIPRNSGNEKPIQEYLINFAKVRNLLYYADEYGNVIIYKKTIDCEPIILQAHTDMVCVKSLNSKTNFDIDGIDIIKKGNFLTAKSTSLGADNGIGMALILDVLDSKIPCNIEAVFTANEETTMQGAYKIDVKKLKSKKMICLDGFDNNTIIISSAGFVDFYATFNNEKLFLENTIDTKTFKLTISGLLGGHSGFDINKNRGSSHKILAKLLTKIQDAKIVKFSGGHNFNVIPSKSECIFSTKLNEKDLKNIIKYFYIENKKIYKTLKIKCTRQVNQNLILKNGKNFIDFIDKFKQGVLEKDENNVVLSSQNISEVSAENGYLKIGIRCTDKLKEKEIIKNLINLCNEYGIKGKVLDSQSAFNTLPNSSLLQVLKDSAINKVSEVKLHIAVESGIFQDRIKNLDVAIISPKIIDAHSINEKVEISSILDTSTWLKIFLTNISK